VKHAAGGIWFFPAGNSYAEEINAWKKRIIPQSAEGKNLLHAFI
jgi:hypothetical protein